MSQEFFSWQPTLPRIPSNQGIDSTWISALHMGLPLRSIQELQLVQTMAAEEAVMGATRSPHVTRLHE